MRIIGCDLHARQQTLAMLDTTTGEIVSITLKHEGDNVREFYSSLPCPVRVGIEATGSMQWFLNLMEELGIECLVGHPAQIRAAAPRKHKNDRRDAELILKMLVEGRFPAIWLPSKELQDLRKMQFVRRRRSVRETSKKQKKELKKTLDTVGVVRDSAFIRHVDYFRKRGSGVVPVTCAAGSRKVIAGARI